MRNQTHDAMPRWPGRLAIAALIFVALSANPAAAEDEALNHAALEAAGWPCWRGPTGSGSAADYPGEVIDDFSQAKVLWNGEDRPPKCYNGTCSRLTGSGCVSPIVWNNRVYMVYHSPSALRRLDAEIIGPTYIRPGQKREDYRIKPEGNPGRIGGFRTKEMTKLPDGSWPYSEAMADNYLHNLYNDDVAVCLDGDTGRILWRTRLLSHFGGNTGSYHNAPCIDDGRLCFLTAGMTRVLCLDAMTGELLWDHYAGSALGASLLMRRKILERAKWELANGGIQHSIAVDGCLVCAAGIFDGMTGERLGDGSSVPTRWVHKGKEYLMSGDACRDVRAGKTLWTTRLLSFGMARGNGSPALSEDYAADFSREGLSGYRISLEGVEKLWTIPGLRAPSSAVVIHKGYVAAATTDKKGRLLIAVEVATGKEAGRLYYDQKGSKNFSPSELNNLCCGITGATATDGRVFWRRYRHTDPGIKGAAGGVTIMNLPVDGRKFSVQVITSRKTSVSSTPAPADGRFFFRMQGFMRCLDFRKNPPPPRLVPPDPVAAAMTGPVTKLGSAYRGERDAAVAALTESASAAQIPDLVRLVVEGNHPTARAAAQVLGGAASIEAKAGEALAELVEQRGFTLPATRLGLALHAFASATPDAASAATRALLGRAAAEPPLLARMGKALRQPVFAGDIGLIKAVLPDLRLALTKADAAGLAAVGEPLIYLDLEPATLTPLVVDLVAAMERVQAEPFTAQRAVLIGLEKNQDEAAFRRAAELAVAAWPTTDTRGGHRGSQTFSMAVLNACPLDIAAIALPKLVVDPRHGSLSLLKKIGDPAIAALVAQYPKARGKAPKSILAALKELGPAGEAAAEKLTKK